jgi:hypothetical protein
MNEDIVVPGLFFLTVIVMSLGIPLVRSYIRRQDRAALPSTLTPELERRLDRLESMVETVQVEVERMAEGQRFTTRLLAEGGAVQRAQSSPAAAPVLATRNEVTHA